MRAFIDWMARRNRLPAVAAGLGLLALTTIATVSYSDGSDATMSIGQLLLVGTLGVILLIALAQTLVTLAGFDPDAALIATRLAADPAEQALLDRWLNRTRWARNVGGLAGLVWWLFGTSLNGDVLLLGVGGVALGSMAAQLHHVQRRSGPRTASLQRRAVGDYLSVGSKRHLVAVGVASLSMFVAGLALGEGRTSAVWAFAALGVLLIANLVQRRVAARPRPALPAGLNAADDLARGLAIDRGLGQPAVYFALVLLAHGALDLRSSVGNLAWWIAAGCWLYALVAWWKNRRLGLDGMLRSNRSSTAAA